MFSLLMLAAVRLAAPFSDGAVLQRGEPVKVWGSADPGEKVTVEFAGQRHETSADGKGRWTVELEPMEASAQGRTLKANDRQIEDVLVGEVWFISGQSNAVCPFWCDIAPRFRSITTGGLMVQYIDRADVRFTDRPGVWKRMNRKNLVKTTPIEKYPNACEGSFSALGTFFALELANTLGVPVGMIGEYVNGSRIEPWLAPDGSSWKGRVARWAPYTIKGILWNQGCSNIINGFEYDTLLGRLYDGWSEAFGKKGGLSFYFMETALGFGECFGLQLAQQRFAASHPRAAIAAGNDLSGVGKGDWHGNDKEVMARRLLVHALKRDYGFADIEDDSPTFGRVAKIDGDKVTLGFDHAKSFFVYNDGMFDFSNRFELLGSDGEWKAAELVFEPLKNWASQGMIASSNITIRAKGVKEPRRVRYLGKGFGNIYNEACLPLLPFEAELVDGARCFPAADYGADEKSADNAPAFKKAMDAAFAAGGGRVVVKRGRWTVSGVELKTGCDLYLEDGAELVAADASRPAVFARGVKGVSVTGPGAIVGAAASGKGESALMKFENCRNVRLDGFSVRAARGNIADFSGCSGVEVRALEALEARGDAFGIEKSEQLTFERCNIKKCRSVFAARSLKRLDARVCRVENAENIFFAAGGDKLGVEDVVLRYVLAGEIGNVFAGACFDGAIRNLSAKNLRAKNIFGAVVDISGKADGIVVEEVNAEEIGRIAKLGVESGSSIGNVALKRIIGRRICRASVVRNAKDVKLDRKDISRAAKSSIAPDNKDVYVLENDRARAEISLKGARVVSWMGKGGKELLFMPERKYAENGDWSHGGIPLCWPWFGRVDGVIHGFVRNRNFTVKESGEGFVVLSLSVAENSEKSFPHAAQLDVRVSLDDKLALSMTTLNAGKKEFSLSCGYHPYFVVSGYKNIVFGGVAEKPFACEDGMDKAFDRRGDGKFGFCDRQLDRELSLRGVGNTHVVVWTPGNVEPCNRNLKPWETEEFIGYGPFVSKGEPKLVLKPGEKSTVTVEMQEVE